MLIGSHVTLMHICCCVRFQHNLHAHELLYYYYIIIIILLLFYYYIGHLSAFFWVSVRQKMTGYWPRAGSQDLFSIFPNMLIGSHVTLIHICCCVRFQHNLHAHESVVSHSFIDI
jgi:hypothetical protein